MHRLEHRARRMAFVISALKEREEAYERRGTVPRPLHDAIAGFAAELRHDRQRLRELHNSSPAIELERVSEHAGLLVLGSRGCGPVRRVALGSTSDRVAHHAGCPVIVVPRPAPAVAHTPAAGETATAAP